MGFCGVRRQRPRYLPSARDVQRNPARAFDQLANMGFLFACQRPLATDTTPVLLRCQRPHAARLVMGDDLAHAGVDQSHVTRNLAFVCAPFVGPDDPASALVLFGRESRRASSVSTPPSTKYPARSAGYLWIGYISRFSPGPRPRYRSRSCPQQRRFPDANARRRDRPGGSDAR